MGSKHRSVAAWVEGLESRCLLSAAVPDLTGAPFEGTVGGGAADLTIFVATENKSGKITGTYTEVSSGSVNTRSFTGSVNSKGKLVLHIKKQVVNKHFV